ncbi:MAG: mechanosensitive ion channel family protein [Oscillospiraceae bacterium]|nr:mechanosensitive ion channel family protein [Oscillospiraceae bacterium]
MEKLSSVLIELGTNVGGKIIYALIVFIVGTIVIKWARKLLDKADKFSRLEKTVQSFLKNLLAVLLYAILIISVISILGIPMTSVIAVLASCGLAVGLALQGALSNFAGGIMILIFKPFRIGDYIEASGAEGTVRDISIFYTSIITVDNKRITVPNSDLMGSKVTNFSCEELRRIDLDFLITNDCDSNFVKGVLMKATENTNGVKAEPAPFARMTAVKEDTFVFTVRAWCDSAKYWDIYFDLLENCTATLAEHGIDDPENRIAVRLVKDEK